MFAFATFFGVAGVANAAYTDTLILTTSGETSGQYIVALEDNNTIDVFKVNFSTGVAEMYDENIKADVTMLSDTLVETSSTGDFHFAILIDDGIAENHYLEVIKYNHGAKITSDLSVYNQTATGNIMFDMAATNNNTNGDVLLAYVDNAGNIRVFDAVNETNIDTGYDVAWDADIDAIAAYSYTERIAIAYETDAGTSYQIKEAVYDTSKSAGIGDYTIKTLATTGDFSDLDAIIENATSDAMDFVANYTDNGADYIIDYFVLDTPTAVTTYNLEVAGDAGAEMDAKKNTASTNIELGYYDITSGDQIIHKTYSDAGILQGTAVSMASTFIPAYNSVSKDINDNISFAFIDDTGEGFTYTSSGLEAFGEQGDGAVPELPANNLWKVLIAVLSLGLVVGIAAFMKKKKK